jgi:hypothetical protein
MLKPNAKKVASHQEVADLVKEFRNNGGLIHFCKTDSAQGLAKKKYLKRS